MSSNDMYGMGTIVNRNVVNKPSGAFVAASWFGLLAGAGAYLVGLFIGPERYELKGLLFVLLMYGLFSAISIQKSVRDRAENIAVTNLYYGLSWISLLICLGGTGWVMFMTNLQIAQKGFYIMCYLLALFASVVVQKNTRDSAA